MSNEDNNDNVSFNTFVVTLGILAFLFFALFLVTSGHKSACISWNSSQQQEIWELEKKIDKLTCPDKSD